MLGAGDGLVESIAAEEEEEDTVLCLPCDLSDSNAVLIDDLDDCVGPLGSSKEAFEGLSSALTASYTFSITSHRATISLESCSQ
jgi:hypothetical protein